MRALRTLAGIGLAAWFAGCNAILGNESEYTLGSGGTADSGGGAGDAGGGTGGKGAAGGKGGSDGAGAGSSGRSGAGGSGQGGSTSAAGGESGETSAAGQAGQAGAAAGAGGEGGEPACVASGEEDCFNGRDDDCNDLTDCEDPACDDSIARCVPVPDGAELGSLAEPPGCAAGSQSLTLYDGLSGPSACEGCTCQPATSRCDAGVYAYGPHACGGFQFDGVLRNVFNDSCTILPPDPNVHYYSIRALSTCDAVGTSVPPPVTWAGTAEFCAVEQLGRGCQAGYRCAPAPAATACVLLPGSAEDCTEDYPNRLPGGWHEGYEDQRACSQCQCGFGLSECVGGSLHFFTDGGCGGTPYPVGAAEGSACPLPITPQSARISGTPASNTCPLQVYPSGSFEPTGPRTVCCQ